MASSDWPRPSVIALVLVAFATIFVALQCASLTRTSATWDEPGNLLAGYAALRDRDYRPAIEHPPAIRMWAALPLTMMRDVSWPASRVEEARPETVAFAGPFESGHAFLYRDNDADRLLYRARLMIVVLAVGLGVLVFCWVGEWLGFKAAVVALTLYLIEPNVAAHGALVTTALGVTAFMFGTVYFLWRTSRNVTAANLAGLAVCFTLAVLSKFSAILLVPAIVLLMAVSRARGGPFTLTTAAGILTLLAFSAWAGAWAVYGFRYAPGPTDDWLFRLHDHPAARAAVPGWASLVAWVDEHGLLPNALTQGFLHGQGLIQGRPAFLAGRYSDAGWWYYFPVAFLLKTPLSLIILALAAVARAVGRRRLFSTNGEAFLVVPILVIVGAAMTSSLNIGLRHILPVYPFVIVLAALSARELFDAARSRKGRAVLAGLLAIAVLEWGRAYPATLAFFNALAGGPANGFRYLADSNVDWGQDLKPLKAWMDRQGIDRVNLAYFGTADPGYYDLDCAYIWGTTIPGLASARIGAPDLPGYVAVSVTLLNGVPFGVGERDFYKPLRDRPPVAVIGGSIRVYWVDRPWW